MSVENDVAKILGSVEGRRHDVWGLAAQRQADGIRASGIAGVVERGSQSLLDGINDSSNRVAASIESASGRVTASIAGLAAVVGASGAQIAGELARSNAFLTQISDAVRNPRSTAADEHYRRGVRALSKDWIPEAIEDLKASVSDNPYSAAAHAALGLAYARNNDGRAAAESYRLGVRYSLSDDLALAAGCALLAAQTYESIDDETSAIATLDSVLDKTDLCPELTLTRARIANDARGVKYALSIAPELAIAAVAVNTPGAREASESLASQNSDVIRDAASVIDGVRMIRATLPTDTTWLHGGSPDLATLDVPDRMTTAGAILRDATRILAQAHQAVRASDEHDNTVRREAENASVATKSAQSSLGSNVAMFIATTALVIAYWAGWSFVVQTFPQKDSIDAGMWLLIIVGLGLVLLIGLVPVHLLWFAAISSFGSALKVADAASLRATLAQPVSDKSSERDAGLRAIGKVASDPRSTRIYPWQGSAQ